MKRFSLLFLVLLAVNVYAQGSDTLSAALEEELRLIGEEDLLLSDPVKKDSVPQITVSETVPETAPKPDSSAMAPDTSASVDTTLLADITSDNSPVVLTDSLPAVDTSSTVTGTIEIEDTTAVAVVETAGTDSAVNVVTVEQMVSVDIESNIEGYKSPFRAMVLSGFVPGLGQAYAKSYWKTGLFVTLETAGIVGAVKFKKTSNEIEEDALKYINSDPAAYDQLMDSSKKRADWSRAMVVGIIVNHIASGVDGFITAKRYNRELAKAKTAYISLDNQLYYSETGSLTTGVSLAWHF